MNAVAVSPDTRLSLVATASRDKTIRLWNPKTGVCERVLVAHDESVKSLCWHPDGAPVLLSGSYDYDARVWNLQAPDGEENLAIPLSLHRNGVGAVGWWNGQPVTASWDGTCIVWRADLTGPDSSVSIFDLGPTMLLEQLAEAELPIRDATMRIRLYDSADGQILLLTRALDSDSSRPLLRIHSQCLTGDALGSLRCDCGEQLRISLLQIAQHSSGMLIYLIGHEGRGIGLIDKIRAYALQDRGFDTVEANLALGFPVDARKYDAVAYLLRNLKVSKVRLLTNNPAKVAALEANGIDVIRIPLLASTNENNRGYLAVKRSAMGHWLPQAPTASWKRPLRFPHEARTGHVRSESLPHKHSWPDRGRAGDQVIPDGRGVDIFRRAQPSPCSHLGGRQGLHARRHRNIRRIWRNPLR